MTTPLNPTSDRAVWKAAFSRHMPGYRAARSAALSTTDRHALLASMDELYGRPDACSSLSTHDLRNELLRQLDLEYALDPSEWRHFPDYE